MERYDYRHIIHISCCSYSTLLGHVLTLYIELPCRNGAHMYERSRLNILLVRGGEHMVWSMQSCANAAFISVQVRFSYFVLVPYDLPLYM